MDQKLTTRADLPSSWYLVAIFGFIIWTFYLMVAWSPVMIVNLYFPAWIYVVGKNKQSPLLPDRTAKS